MTVTAIAAVYLNRSTSSEIACAILLSHSIFENVCAYRGRPNSMDTWVQLSNVDEVQPSYIQSDSESFRLVSLTHRWPHKLLLSKRR